MTVFGRTREHFEVVDSQSLLVAVVGLGVESDYDDEHHYLKLCYFKIR